MTIAGIKHLLCLFGTVEAAISLPLQSLAGFPKLNGSGIALSQGLTLNNSSLDITFKNTLRTWDPVDYSYPIPNSDPPRRLQMTYNKDSTIQSGGAQTVITTIWTRLKSQISKHGDGPVYPNPYEYHVKGCYSSTTAVPRLIPATNLTFGMLQEIMRGLWITFEDLGNFYEVHYELIEQRGVVWAFGSLTRFPEEITASAISSS